MGWPANSPDLNSIEIVWNLMKKRLKYMNIDTVQLIKEALLRAWEQICAETVRHLISSMPGISKIFWILAVS